MHKAIGLFSNTVAVQIYTAEGEKSEGQIQIRNLCKHLPCFLTDFFLLFSELPLVRFSFRIL